MSTYEYLQIPSYIWRDSIHLYTIYYQHTFSLPAFVNEIIPALRLPRCQDDVVISRLAMFDSFATCSNLAPRAVNILSRNVYWEIYGYVLQIVQDMIRKVDPGLITLVNYFWEIQLLEEITLTSSGLENIPIFSLDFWSINGIMPMTAMAI